MLKKTKETKQNSFFKLSAAARVPIISAFAVLFMFAGVCGYIVLSAEPPPPPPEASPVRVVAWAGAELEADIFVTDISGEDVIAYFSRFKPLELRTGKTDVIVTLRDKHGHSAYVTSQLQSYCPEGVIAVEIGEDISSMKVSDFISGVISQEDIERFSLITDMADISTDTISTYDVVITLDGIAPPNNPTIKVEDVIAPQATPVKREHWTVDELNPADFVTNIIDQTEVTVSFAEEPDRTVVGEQLVQILLTDEGGNQTVITTTLLQKLDTEAPVIIGEFDKAACIGEPIIYRAGITVTDNRDEDITLEVDSSAVDANIEGIYPVIYSATDLSGNTTSVEGTVTIYDVPIEAVEEMVAEMLDYILKEDMTLEEKAKAIFNFVRGRIAYGTGRNYDNINYAAYRAYRTGVGDCYAYYSLSELLLTGAGIDNIGIRRIDGYPTRHFWNLVNLGDGWYHFDPAPGHGGGFMFTDTRAKEITSYMRNSIPGYYDYDETLYPEIVA